MLDWNLVKQVDGIKVHYKHEVDTGIHSIKMEGFVKCILLSDWLGVMDSPLFDIIAVIYELDLYIQWWPLLKVQSKPIRLIYHRNRKS